MIRQQVVAPTAGTQRCMPETIRISPSIATSRTSPSPPKKLTAVSVFRAWRAIGLIVGQAFLVLVARICSMLSYINGGWPAPTTASLASRSLRLAGPRSPAAIFRRTVASLACRAAGPTPRPPGLALRLVGEIEVGVFQVLGLLDFAGQQEMGGHRRRAVVGQVQQGVVDHGHAEHRRRRRCHSRRSPAATYRPSRPGAYRSCLARSPCTFNFGRGDDRRAVRPPASAASRYSRRRSAESRRRPRRPAAIVTGFASSPVSLVTTAVRRPARRGNRPPRPAAARPSPLGG